MVFFTYRWVPHYQYLRQLVNDGYIGKCFSFHFRYLSSSNLDDDPGYRWRFDKKRAIGALGGLGSHMIDLVRWCIGEICLVSASVAVHMPWMSEDRSIEPANDSAILSLKLGNGAHGVIQVSDVAAVSQQEQYITIQGSEGILEVNFSLADAQIFGMRKGEKEKQMISVPDHYWGDTDQNQPFYPRLGELIRTQSLGDRLFIDSIIHDAPATPTFCDGLKAQEVISAALESHESRKIIEIKL
jgi:predicted dehydrogenase